MSSPLEKFWANSQSRGAAIGGLVGAGGLGLAGYLMSDKEQKKRSALIAALLGGGIGAGAGWYANMPKNLASIPPAVAHPQNIAGLVGQGALGPGDGWAALMGPLAMQQGGGRLDHTTVPAPNAIPGQRTILSPELQPEVAPTIRLPSRAPGIYQQINNELGPRLRHGVSEVGPSVPAALAGGVTGSGLAEGFIRATSGPASRVTIPGYGMGMGAINTSAINPAFSLLGPRARMAMRIGAPLAGAAGLGLADYRSR